MVIFMFCGSAWENIGGRFCLWLAPTNERIGTSEPRRVTMPRSIPVPVRLALLRGFKKGDSVSVLAARFNLSSRTVRHLIQKLQDQSDLSPAYQRCGQPESTPTALIAEGMRLRQQHGSWGAGLIRVLLQEEHPQEEVPCVRTLQRWLLRLRADPAPPGRKPANESQRARRPHDIWQMDAAEQKRLKTGQQISWLRIADECSGAVLKTVVFPPRELESGTRS